MMDLLDKCSPSLQAEVWSGKNLPGFLIKKKQILWIKKSGFIDSGLGVWYDKQVKVRIFWVGHKNLKHLPLFFDVKYQVPYSREH